ncbi:MAG: lactate racemase domain-containing protein [Pirellulaceae bacterium]
MTLYFAEGTPTTEISDTAMREALFGVYQQLGGRRRVLAIPPDNTRANSRAGILTCMTHEYYQDRLADVMPALGTHYAMSPEQLDQMFPGLPHDLIRVHRWRDDVVTIGQVPAEYVQEVTEGIWNKPWPAQLNRLIWEGGHDLIISLGQVVPHEVIGMANYNKNIFVGTGGVAGINESHYIGAAYGMERMMGRADTPLRRILNYAQREFCQHLPLLYVQTVVGVRDDGHLVTRGLYIGDDEECFEQAAALARLVNFKLFDQPLDKVVVYLDPHEFHSTWLGNKAIYRTRMAIADNGHLIVLGPSVSTFGEDPEIDKMIRKFGYRGSEKIRHDVGNNHDLQQNLSAAAHLMHGSSEGRFRITYCPGKLTEKEITSVGYEFADLPSMLQRYRPEQLKDGWNTLADGERFYYISNPALGLWACRQRFQD